MNRWMLLSCAGLLAGSAWVFAQTPMGPTSQPAGEKRTTSSGLTIVESGPANGAQDGDTVSVHYTGTLEDGTKFDSSLDRGKPLDLTLGRGQVIKGWEEGLLGMNIGQKRKLIIPPNLAYGENPPGGKIPKNATLIFDVQMMGIRRGGQ